MELGGKGVEVIRIDRCFVRIKPEASQCICLPQGSPCIESGVSLYL